MKLLERQVSYCGYARELWIGKYPVFLVGCSLDQRPQLLSMAFANVTRQLSTDGTVWFLCQDIMRSVSRELWLGQWKDRLKRCLGRLCKMMGTSFRS